jgi:geranylgeranyl diphosphate synthase type I
VAVLAGDLAAVLADRLLLASGFEPASLVRALEPYHEMRVDMALGQYLDVAGLSRQPEKAREVAWLKGGAYTVEGPLQVGAAFAGAGDTQRAALHAFGRPLGEAFQLRDDVTDGEAATGLGVSAVNELVKEARSALSVAHLEPEAVAALDELASLVAMA